MLVRLVAPLAARAGGSAAPEMPADVRGRMLKSLMKRSRGFERNGAFGRLCELANEAEKLLEVKDADDR